jgi:hypothetical protein
MATARNGSSAAPGRDEPRRLCADLAPTSQSTPEASGVGPSIAMGSGRPLGPDVTLCGLLMTAAVGAP